jgi:hypothetical protein
MCCSFSLPFCRTDENRIGPFKTFPAIPCSKNSPMPHGTKLGRMRTLDQKHQSLTIWQELALCAAFQRQMLENWHLMFDI